ncbi:CidA/LrgA family protein [Ectothiorhodospira shaposhnikovii]|uniref:CidA/LrgA family protein n=1 Tax=Ectothiorhodospira shaposhnikovii TaxID=1054 RepID=UPI001EE81CE4|nr:CidA/LrgA family protein [Ectothiorhodospira shaposhnikovii]MCG5514413.1 CidA/LrgA family protein [Ectothiorhodospira shaposhnikovii]
MLQAIIIILLCQLVGEVTVLVLDLPFPGPVLGMLLLFAGLVIRGETPPALKAFSDTLLRYLALLFVPAGVGLMVHFGLVARDWLPILAALLVSTVLALVVTMLVLSGLIRLRARRHES